MKTAYNLFRVLFCNAHTYEKGLQELDARLCADYNETAA